MAGRMPSGIVRPIRAYRGSAEKARLLDENLMGTLAIALRRYARAYIRLTNSDTASTVMIPATTIARLLIAPSISPMLIARVVPEA